MSIPNKTLKRIVSPSPTQKPKPLTKTSPLTFDSSPKLETVQDSIVKEIQGNDAAGWCGGDAIGYAGGILVIWNDRSFIVRDRWIGGLIVSVLEDISSSV